MSRLLLERVYSGVASVQSDKTSEHKSNTDLKKDEGKGAEVGKETASIASAITKGVTYAGATCQNVNF